MLRLVNQKSKPCAQGLCLRRSNSVCSTSAAFTFGVVGLRRPGFPVGALSKVHPDEPARQTTLVAEYAVVDNGRRMPELEWETSQRSLEGVRKMVVQGHIFKLGALLPR